MGRGEAFVKKDVLEESIIQALKTAKIQINITDKDGNPIKNLMTYLEEARKYQEALTEFEEWLDGMNDDAWGQDKTSFSITKKLQKLKKKHDLPYNGQVLNEF